MEVMRDLVGIQRFGGGEIEANKPTWIVIHGRESYASASPAIKGTAGENNMYRLAEALEAYERENDVADRKQILVADWRSFAGANEKLASLEGTAFIREAALAFTEMLQNVDGNGNGISPNQMNIVGHSWGTYVAYVMAEIVPGKVNSFVALDSAANPWPMAAAIGSADAFANMNLRDVAENSLAFEGGLLGSDSRSATANQTFFVSLPLLEPTNAHGQVVEVFADMILDQTADKNAPVARHFLLDDLLTGNRVNAPWQENGQAALIPEGYEGRINTHWVNKRAPNGDKLYEALDIDYTDPITGKLVEHKQ